MTKITVEQAVSAVKSATTQEELQAALEQCTKEQLHEVFLAVTFAGNELSPKSWKKAELVKAYTARIAAFKAETPAPVEPVMQEVKPDYDAEFDETAYTPSVEEVSVIIDDIPVDHEPDVHEASATTYEDMRKAYTSYENAMFDYDESHNLDSAAKDTADKAYREYLRLLGKYRKEGMLQRGKALSWLREHFSDKWLPADALSSFPHDKLLELSHACGIHAARFQGISRCDMAVRLLREAGIESELRTSYEYAIERRKEWRVELHEVWQRRRVLRKALNLLGEGSDDARILSDMCSGNTMSHMNSKSIEYMLGKYKEACATCKKGRMYEADSRLADALAMAKVQSSKPDDNPAPTSLNNGEKAPAKFVIGRHYPELGASDPRVYTFVGMCGRHYGYFVDSLNIYHKAKIKVNANGTTECANARKTHGCQIDGWLQADHEVSEHEILSVKNGTLVLLNAETVIHSYGELEEYLAPKTYQQSCEVDTKKEVIAV